MEKVIAKLDSTHQRLLDAIAPVDPERFSRRPSDDEWSVAEVVHHLCLVEKRVLKELEGGSERPPQRMGLLQRLIPMRAIVGSRALRVKSPKMVEPLNPPPKDEVIANYNTVRAKLKEFCLGAGRARLKQFGMQHPFLGPLDGIRAVTFIGSHELRHYKQIREIIKKIGN